MVAPHVQKDRFDTLIVGGGIMGCATALGLSTAGMHVALIERGALCAAASGVNAGTLSILIKRPALVPYALRGLELWQSTSPRLGFDIGYHTRGGLSLAFTRDEAEALMTRTAARQEAGAPIEIVAAGRARALDPGVTDRVVLASHCPIDGYANANLTGVAYRLGLRRMSVDVREHTPVTSIARDGSHYEVHSANGIVTAPRIVIATGAWLRDTLQLLGVDLPVQFRVNQVSVTERCRRLVRVIVSHALGALTLKQSDNGTVLIGGGWQGKGDPSTGHTRTDTNNLVNNLRLAQYAVPALSSARLLRTWLGFEAYVPDFMPLAGPLPDHADAYVLGCVRGGWTIGPFIGQLLADHMLGRQTEMPLFDPSRLTAGIATAG